MRIETADGRELARLVTADEHDALAKRVAALSSRVDGLHTTDGVAVGPAHILKARPVVVEDTFHIPGRGTIWLVKDDRTLFPGSYVTDGKETRKVTGIERGGCSKMAGLIVRQVTKPEAANGYADPVKEAQAAGLRTSLRLDTLMHAHDGPTFEWRDGLLWLVKDGEVIKRLDVSTQHPMPPKFAAFSGGEGWTHSVYRSATGIAIEAKPPAGSGRPILTVNVGEATARWLGGRVLAALDLPPQETTIKVAEEPKAGAYLRNPISRLVHLVEVRATVDGDSTLGDTWWVTTNPMVVLGSLVQERGAKDRVMEVVDIGELSEGRSRLVVKPAKE